MKPPVYDPNWSDEVKILFNHDMEEIWDRAIAPQMWIQYHNQLDLYQSLVSNDHRQRVLDIGCAQATLALKLAEAGHDIVALDLRQGFLDYARSRHTEGDIQFVCANAFEDSIDIGEFDVVFANQIIEHVFDPIPKITSLARYLKEGGRLIITTPNWEYFINKLPTLNEFEKLDASKFREFTADADGHVYAYTLKELEMVCTLAGFAPTKTMFFETPLISGHYKVRYLQTIIPSSLLKWFDRFLLNLPWIGRKLAHQLLIICEKTEQRAQ